MSAVAAARENMIGLAHALNNIMATVGDNPTNPADRQRLQAAETAFTTAEARYRQLKTAADAEGPATPSAGLTGSLLRMDGSPIAGPAPSLHGGRPDGGNRPWSLGSAYIDARMARSPGGDFRASGLLDPGSIAVSVPIRAQPFEDPRRAHFVYELIGQEDAPNGQFSYMKQTRRDLRAAVVARGAKKPESGFGLVRVPDTTKVIAHVTEPIDRFDLQDAPNLRTFIDLELALGLDLALDARIVAALMDAATFETGTLGIVGIRDAITTLQQGEMAPDAVLLSPADWQDIESDATALFAFLVANSGAGVALEAMQQRLWSVPVVVTNSIPTGTALVGCFREAALLYVTGGIQIDVSDSASRVVDGETLSGFQTNELRFRAERRAEIAIGRPTGFVLVGAEGS